MTFQTAKRRMWIMRSAGRMGIYRALRAAGHPIVAGLRTIGTWRTVMTPFLFSITRRKRHILSRMDFTNATAPLLTRKENTYTYSQTKLSVPITVTLTIHLFMRTQLASQ